MLDKMFESTEATKVSQESTGMQDNGGMFDPDDPSTFPQPQNEENTQDSQTQAQNEQTTEQPENEAESEEMSFNMDAFETPGKFMEFTDTSKRENPFTPPVEAPQAPITPEQAATPEPTVSETMMANASQIGDLFKEFYDHYGTIEGAQRAYNAHMRQLAHNEQQKADNEAWRKDQEEKNQVAKAGNEIEQLRPEYNQNMIAAVTEGGWGTMDNMVKALIDPKLGGNLIGHLFNFMNPDSKFKGAEEFKKAQNDFIVKMGANKGLLTELENHARAKMLFANKKKIAAHYQQTAQNNLVQKKRSGVRSTANKRTGMQQTTQTSQQKRTAVQKVDDWFSAPSGR